MLSVPEQIEMGALVCPTTKTRLRREGDFLISEAGTRYHITDGGVPILLADAAQAEQYVRGSSCMVREYGSDATVGWAGFVGRLKQALNKDYRTRASRIAFDKIIKSSRDHDLCLSIGGGPTRQSPNLTNVNIGPFSNVDVVADAHLLPYASGAVHAIYCEAVLEHLEDPPTAVQEMFRVLERGGRVIAITPFMQGFHGYPYHFQNFTLLGHCSLFSHAGFRVVESGVCVGPTYTVVSEVGRFFYQCLPKVIGLPLAVLWKLFGAFLRPLDLILGRAPAAHVLASTTYVVAEKPNGATAADPS